MSKNKENPKAKNITPGDLKKITNFAMEIPSKPNTTRDSSNSEKPKAKTK